MKRRGSRQALAAVTVGLVFWTLLDSVALYHEAKASPLGTRRTVALAVLGPVAATARVTGLDWPVDELDRVLGRDPAPALAATTGGRGGRAGAGVRTFARVRTPPTTVVTVTRAPLTTAPPPDVHRVLVIGDSLGKDLGNGLAQQWAEAGIAVDVDARPVTGLSRPDYFDWPVRLRTDLATDRPGLVVVMIGGNDAQPFLVDGQPASFGSPAWDRAYRSRVAAIVAETEAAGSRLVWVGMPICASPSFSTEMAHLDRIYLSQAVPGVMAFYFASWALFTTAGGAYSSYLPGPGGAPQLVRQPDGIHLTVAGVSRLGAALTAALRGRDWLPGLSGRP